jgi:hypothetical protein
MEKKIRVYYHCSFLNDFMDITTYIFDKMVDSGLMDACEGVFIGALGDENELPKFKELISKYPKAKIVEWHPDVKRYECHTIRHLREDAEILPPFVAVYCHSKSVTYKVSDDKESKAYKDKLHELCWMRLMTNEVICRWEKGYEVLTQPDFGYDIFGTRVTPLRESGSQYTHCSGNFIMTTSEYVKTLPMIVDNIDVGTDAEEEIHEHYRQIKRLCRDSSIDIHGNIFLSEMIWSFQQPIFYISSNPMQIPFDKYYEELIAEGYPIENYRTK